MRMVVWNILHGGGTRRTPEIALRLHDLQPDLVVLTEFRRAMGGQIAGILYDLGLREQASTEPPAGRNGVIVAARTPVNVAEPPPAEWARNRWLDLHLAGMDLWLTAIHAPDTHRSDPERMQRQAAYWQHLVRVARPRAAGRHIIAGDLNTGRHGLDEAGQTFTGTVFLGQISTMGYRDAYRLGTPTGGDRTWSSHTGSGFRIDAVWVSSALRESVVSVRHEHAARAARESDHTPVVAEIVVNSPGSGHCGAKNP